MPKLFLLLSFVILSCSAGIGQNNSLRDTAINYTNAKAVNNSSSKLLNSIRENKKPEAIAANYFDLAEQLVKAGDYIRAELYMNRAVQSEAESKTKMRLAEYYRELARIQELQNKFSNASNSFRKAEEFSQDSLQKQLNRNDANRLLHKASPTEELIYLNQNAAILSTSGNQNEKLQNFTQQANANIALNQNARALENFKDALNTVDSNSENSVAIKNGMVNLLAASNDIGHAIALQKDVVRSAQTNSDIGMQVVQLRNLSSLYFRVDSTEAGLRLLKNAYELAVAKGNLKEAEESLKQLTAAYEKSKQEEKVAALYRDFLSRLDNLIAKDSSFIDKNLFLVNEGKIAELEQQQVLKDDLIVRKNRSNFLLTGFVILLVMLLLIIIKAWFFIRRKNKMIALQSLRREMNPHFIFNSLNSVNQFIANNNEREANKYLTSYSALMRNMMEHSNKDYVPLNVELEQLKKYLELEKMRFPDKFDYRIEAEPGLDLEKIQVPNMILQPNLENAIWHGLRYKESSGLLRLKFSRNGTATVAIIEDNGIGLTESEKIKTKNQKLHESLGLKNVKERIRLLNEIYKAGIRFEISEKTGMETGVIVRIEW